METGYQLSSNPFMKCVENYENGQFQVDGLYINQKEKIIISKIELVSRIDIIYMKYYFNNCIAEKIDKSDVLVVNNEKIQVEDLNFIEPWRIVLFGL